MEHIAYYYKREGYRAIHAGILMVLATANADIWFNNFLALYRLFLGG